MYLIFFDNYRFVGYFFKPTFSFAFSLVSTERCVPTILDFSTPRNIILILKMLVNRLKLTFAKDEPLGDGHPVRVEPSTPLLSLSRPSLPTLLCKKVRFYLKGS